MADKKPSFRSFDSTKADLYKIDISKTISDNKTSIAQISRDALSKHRTQGMDKVDKNSPFFFGNRFYQLVRSDGMYPVEGDNLFSGLTHNMKWNTSDLISYETKYSYKIVNPEDSVQIKSRIEYNPAAYIGLVKTYDNTIENILQAFGIKYDTISVDMLKNGDLGRFSTVILDLRAYLYRPDLVEYNRNVLDYAYQGGNILCFYNKPGE